MMWGLVPPGGPGNMIKLLTGGTSGMNKLQQLLRGSDLLSPVETAVMRCK
jgi:hypothetical protein